MKVNRNQAKNERLMKERGVSFEDVIVAIEEGNLLYEGEHPNPEKHPQKAFIVNIKKYAYLIPFVVTEEEIFLKTIYPSRVLTKKFGLK